MATLKRAPLGQMVECHTRLGRGIESHKERGVVILSKTLYLHSFYWFNPEKRHDLPEILLTETLNQSQTGDVELHPGPSLSGYEVKFLYLVMTV